MKSLPMKSQLNRVLDNEFRTIIIEIKAKSEQIDISQKIYILSRSAVLEAVINPNDIQTRKERNEKARRLLELTRSLVIQISCPDLVPPQCFTTQKAIYLTRSSDSRMTGSKSSTSIQQYPKFKIKNQSPEDNQSLASTIRDCDVIKPYLVDTKKKSKQLFHDMEQSQSEIVTNFFRDDRNNEQNQSRGFKNVSNSLKKSLDRAIKNQNSFNQFLSSLQKQ